MKMHQCNFCDYQSSRNYNLKVHVKNKHYKAPISMTQPTIDYSSAAENRQHLTGYQVPNQGIPHQSGSGVLHTTQQYDPRVRPQIQYNEQKHQGQGPQTSINYSVSQNPVKNEDTDNETDTETVSEADTEDLSDEEEHDVYEILNDIHLAFNHLKDLREQYRKALPQLKELDEEEMDQFLY